MDPGGIESFYAPEDVTHRVLVGEGPHLPIEAAHLRPEILGHDRGLVARLDKEIRWEEAFRRLVEEHHRVPMVDVGRLEKAQLVPSEVDHVSLDVTLHSTP